MTGTLKGTITNVQVFPYARYGSVFYKFHLRSIDPRPDRFSVFGPSGCVVSGLTSYQSQNLLQYLSRLEDRVAAIDTAVQAATLDGTVQLNLSEMRLALTNLFKDTK